MLIATKQHTAGNKTRYEVLYDEWLDCGRTLNQVNGFSATLVAPAPADVTVGQASTTSHSLYFWVQGGSVNEVFTVQVEVADTLGEIVVDTILFTVVAP